MTAEGEGGAVPPRGFRLFFWAGALVLVPFLFWNEWRQVEGLHLTEAHLLVGRDFLNVWTGGRLAIGHELGRLYDYQAYMNWQAARFGPLDDLNYSYPPHSLFLATPFAVLPYGWALAAWTLLGLAFFYWAARPYTRNSLFGLGAVLTPAAFANIWFGHYGFVIGGLWLLFFSSLERRPVRTGVLAALLTLKPHLGLLIAVVMVLRRQYLAITVAIAATLCLVLLSGMLFGFSLWHDWLFVTSRVQQAIMTAPWPRFYFLMMPSAFIALHRFPDWIALVGQIACAAGGAALFWKGRGAAPRDLAFIAATATALMSPYIFNYDLTVVCLGFVLCLYRCWPRLGEWEKRALWLAFAVPLFGIVFNLFPPLGLLSPLFLMAGLAVLVRQADYGEEAA